MTKSTRQFKVEQRVVYDLMYLDEFGRWMTYSSYNTPERAEADKRSASRVLNKVYSASDYGVDPMKAGPTRNPYGE